jgi:hypothetical protein
MAGLKARIPRSGGEYLPILAIIVGGTVLSAPYSLKATNWAVMTDELQSSKLATSIAETFSPAPRIHGAYYHALSQLYPLLISPFFGLLTAPAAVEAAHILNGFLLASAAWPAGLLARRITRSWPAAYLAAALTTFVPWLVLSTTLLTENAAYPAFVWAVFLMHRALVTQSTRAHAAALLGLVIAFFARTQLLVLAVGFLIALLVDALAHGLGKVEGGARVVAPLRAARNGVIRQPLLVTGYATVGVAACALAATGQLKGILGTYGGTLQSNPFPPGIWHTAAVHFEYLVVGLGLVPFLLAFSWAFGLVGRRGERDARAFAILLLVLTPLITLQAASFDERFTPGAFTEDRYLAYLGPLFAIGAAAAIVDRERRVTRGMLALCLTVGFSLLTHVGSLPAPSVIFWAAPAAAFQPALGSVAALLHLSTISLVRYGSLVVGAVVVAALWRAPPLPTLVTVGLASVALGITEVIYVFDRFAVPTMTRPRGVASAQRDWVDAAVPPAESVGLVPSPNVRREFWWDVEFWNKRVDRLLRIDGSSTYSPFPAERFSVDRKTGAVRGLGGARFLVVASSENRIHFIRSAVVASAPPLRLLSVGARPRVDWSMTGAYRDGWSRPGKPLSVLLFSANGPGEREARLTLRAPPAREGRLRFELRGSGFARLDQLPPGGARRLSLNVCMPERGPAEVTLLSHNGVALADGRLAGPRIDSMKLVDIGQPCPRRRASAS